MPNSPPQKKRKPLQDNFLSLLLSNQKEILKIEEIEALRNLTRNLRMFLDSVELWIKKQKK